MVTNLFIKRARGESLSPVSQLVFSATGIVDNVSCSPLRQVLILPNSTLEEFHLSPGHLRENVIVEYPDLHSLPSGTVLRAGVARIRLTFHCEPCGRVTEKARASALMHKRGYLGQFLNAGIIHKGDAVTALGVECEPVPYPVKERIQWYLERQVEPILAAHLLFECGIPVGYARAMPNLLKSIPAPLAALVVFKSHQTRATRARQAQLPL